MKGGRLVQQQAEPDFAAHVIARLDEVADWCHHHGQRLTITRRLVLGLILAEERPLGAYDILSLLREYQPKAVPPTVYRALEFLLEQGLIHRIERLSAFVGCHHRLACHADCKSHKAWGVHRAQFLICRHCGRVQELEQDVVAAVLLQSARGQGFHAEAATVEIEGTCAECAAAGQSNGNEMIDH
ncbi:Fur family transcriptional regulator [Bombella saccharophila]|uniref:Transcriptional repressor n=1 Tax=Bombella saccharophila TaxID=2967338 RepID=A0ABT3WAP1_9PROT|nr:transcriptional repressor [Bombella saccharophila]MCX5614849.1 transcriptional repressor [Bombella saccharophila]PHI96427.1 transcriptional repressor [Parasaccharibacter apium]